MFVYRLDSSPIRSKIRNDDHIEYEILKIKILELETKLKERKYLRIKRQNDLTNPQSSSSGISKGNKKGGEIENATLTYNESAETLGRAKSQRAPASLLSEPDARSKGKLKERVFSNRARRKTNDFELDEHQVSGELNRPPSDLPSSADKPMPTGAIVDEHLSQLQNAAGSELKSKIAISATEKPSSAPTSSISKALPLGRVKTEKKMVPRITSEQHGHSKLDVPNASSCEETSSTTSLKSSSDSKSSKGLDKLVPATHISALPLTDVQDTVHLYKQETQGTQQRPVRSSRSSIRAGEATLGLERHAERQNVQPPDSHSDRGIDEEQAAGNDFENAMDTQSNWLERLGTKIKKMPNLPRALFPKKGNYDHAGLANEAKSRVSDTGTTLPTQTADRTAPIISEERDDFEQRPTAVGSTIRKPYGDYGSAPPYREAWILHISMETGAIATSPLAMNNSELQEVVRKFHKKGRLVWRSFTLLSSLQQQEINLLLLDKYEYDQLGEPLAWTLQALEIFPKRSKAAKIRSIKILIEAWPCHRAYALRQLRLYQSLERERGEQTEQRIRRWVPERVSAEPMEQHRFMHPTPHHPLQGHYVPPMSMPLSPPHVYPIQPVHRGPPLGLDPHSEVGHGLRSDDSEDSIIVIEDLGPDDRYGPDRINPHTDPIHRHRRQLSRHSLATKSSSDDSNRFASSSRRSRTRRRRPSESAMPRSARSIAQSIPRRRRAAGLGERLGKRQTEEHKRDPLPMEVTEGQESNKYQPRSRHRSRSDESQSPPRQAAQEPAIRSDVEPEVTIDNLLSKWTIFGAS